LTSISEYQYDRSVFKQEMKLIIINSMELRNTQCSYNELTFIA